MVALADDPHLRSRGRPTHGALLGSLGAIIGGFAHHALSRRLADVLRMSSERGDSCLNQLYCEPARCACWTHRALVSALRPVMIDEKYCTDFSLACPSVRGAEALVRGEVCEESSRRFVGGTPAQSIAMTTCWVYGQTGHGYSEQPRRAAPAWPEELSGHSREREVTMKGYRLERCAWVAGWRLLPPCSPTPASTSRTCRAAPETPMKPLCKGLQPVRTFKQYPTGRVRRRHARLSV